MNTSGQENQRNSPLLCANACGFYGSPTTNNMCSKCYRAFIQLEQQRQQDEQTTGAVTAALAAAAAAASSQASSVMSSANEQLTAESAPLAPGESTTSNNNNASISGAAFSSHAAASNGAPASSPPFVHDGTTALAPVQGHKQSTVVKTSEGQHQHLASVAAAGWGAPSSSGSSSAPQTPVGTAEAAAAAGSTSFSDGPLFVVSPPIDSANGAAALTWSADDDLMGQVATSDKPEVGGGSEQPGVASSPAEAAGLAAVTTSNAAEQKNKGRCYQCNKRIGLLGFQCRCGYFYCGVHRHADRHDCKFDYVSFGRQQLSKVNKKVVADKLNRI